MQSKRCHNCNGTGQFFLVSGMKCPDCKGAGYVDDRCYVCKGRGKLWLGGDEYLDCPHCEGRGYEPNKRTYHHSKPPLQKVPMPGE